MLALTTEESKIVENTTKEEWVAHNYTCLLALKQYRKLIVEKGSAELLESFDNTIYKSFIECCEKLASGTPDPDHSLLANILAGLILFSITVVPWICGIGFLLVKFFG